MKHTQSSMGDFRFAGRWADIAEPRLCADRRQAAQLESLRHASVLMETDLWPRTYPSLYVGLSLPVNRRGD